MKSVSSVEKLTPLTREVVGAWHKIEEKRREKERLRHEVRGSKKRGRVIS